MMLLLPCRKRQQWECGGSGVHSGMEWVQVTNLMNFIVLGSLRNPDIQGISHVNRHKDQAELGHNPRDSHRF